LLEGCAKDESRKRCEDLLLEENQDLLGIRQLSEEVEEFQRNVLQEFGICANIGVCVLVLIVNLLFKIRGETFEFIFSNLKHM
jgi:hypothetical protein